ncbi:hypothetical protein OG579_13635 [Williamsia herbipolensis]|uniref:HTH cro/C1-type domain-containing protein n=1 Tax=Williamsia herbipolensis TaxID=1603258 RepID=A0AAU4JYC5_9NOCA|nr:hypothetical protein [Williamsia herbipolensis]
MSNDVSWADTLTARVGRAVRQAREPRSVQWLSDRTYALGRRISKATISELETGKRKALPVTDLLLLAAALEVPPVGLLVADLPDGDVEILPRQAVRSVVALRWISGEDVLAERPGTRIVGQDGLEHFREWGRQRDVFAANAEPVVRARTIFELRERIDAAARAINAARTRLESLTPGSPRERELRELHDAWQSRFDADTAALFDLGAGPDDA